MNATATTGDSHESGGETRRDFLYLSAGAMAAVGTGAVLWPLIDRMNPAADILAQATVEVDLGPIGLGQRLTVGWRADERRVGEECVESCGSRWSGCNLIKK